MSGQDGNPFSPAQGVLTINPLLDLNINSLEFLPHWEIIYWSLFDFFRNRYNLLTDNDKSAIESIKGKSVGEAGLIACQMNQTEYGLSIIGDSSDPLSNIVRSLYTYNKPNEAPDKLEYKGESEDEKISDQFIRFSTANKDSIYGIVENANKTIQECAKDDSKISWLSNLIYGTLLSLSELDKSLAENQINLAKKKIGGDSETNYVFLSFVGNIYRLQFEYSKAIIYFEKAISIIKNDGYCRPKLFHCYCKLSLFDKAKSLLNTMISDGKQGGNPSSNYNPDKNGTFSEYFSCIFDYFEFLISGMNNKSLIDKLASYDRKNGKEWFCQCISMMMESLGQEKYKTEWMLDVAEGELMDLMGKNDKKVEGFKTSTWGNRFVCIFTSYVTKIACVTDPDDAEYVQEPNSAECLQKIDGEILCDAYGMMGYYSGVFKMNWKNATGAMKCYDTAIKLRGSFFPVRIAYIVGLNDSGNAPKAEKIIDEMRKFGELPGSLNLIKVNALRFAGALSEAENELFKRISENSNAPNIDMCLALSDVLCYSGHYQAALIVFGQILIQYPDLFWESDKYWEFKLRYAFLLSSNGFIDFAYKLYRIYHLWIKEDETREPDSDQWSLAAFFNTAACVGNAGILLSVTRMSQGPWLYFRRAHLYFIYNKYDKAFDDGNQLISDFPDHPMGYCIIARSHADINPDNVENNINDCVERANKLYDNKDIEQWMYYEIMMHCACALQHCGKDGKEYEGYAKKINENDAFRKQYNGSNDGRKWLIDEQYKILCDANGDKEKIKIEMKGLLDKMKIKFDEYYKDFESEIPKPKKKMKDADYEKVKNARIKLFDVVKNNFIQIKWDFNKAKELSNIKQFDQIPSILDSFIHVGPPGKPQPAPITTSKSKTKSESKMDDSVTTINHDDGKDDEKSDVLVSTSTSSGGNENASGGNINDIFKDRSGLQYIMHGSKTFPMQRIVSSFILDETLIISELLAMSLQNAWYDTKGFEENDYENRVIFGGKVNGTNIYEEVKENGNESQKLYAYTFLNSAEAISEIGMAFDGKYSGDGGVGSGETNFNNLVGKVSKLNDDFSKISYATYLAKCGQIDLSKEIFDKYLNNKSSLFITRQLGWFILRICNNYKLSKEILSEAYNKFNGKLDPLTVSYYLQSLCLLIEETANKYESISLLRNELSEIVENHIHQNKDANKSTSVMSCSMALYSYGSFLDDRFNDGNKTLYDACLQANELISKIIHYYYECGRKEIQYNNISDIAEKKKAKYGELNSLVQGSSGIEKYWLNMLLLMSANVSCKSVVLFNQNFQSMSGSLYGTAEGSLLPNYTNCYIGKPNEMAYTIGVPGRFGCLENATFECVGINMLDPSNDSGGFDEYGQRLGDWKSNQDGLLNKMNQLYNLKDLRGIPFNGNKCFFIRYIDLLRLKYCENYNYRELLDHKKIISLINEYLLYYPNDYNGLIVAADYWLSIGCIQAAYIAYNKCENKHEFLFYGNTIVQLKYADCLFMLGQFESSYSIFKNVFDRFILTGDEKRVCKLEIGQKQGFTYDYFLNKFALLAFIIGKKDEANNAMTRLTTHTKGDFKHSPPGWIVSLLLNDGEIDKNCKKTLDELGKNKLSAANKSYKLYHNLDINNTLLKKLIIHDNLKDGPNINSTNLTEDGTKLNKLDNVLKNDIFSFGVSCNIDENNLSNYKSINISDIDISIVKSIVDKALIDYQSNDCVKIKYELSVSSGSGGARGSVSSKPSAAKSSSPSSSKPSKSQQSVTTKSRLTSSRGSIGGPDELPKSASLQQVESWLREQESSRPLETPIALEVSLWEPPRLAQFVQSVPFFQYNDKYAELVKQKGITGEQFLNATFSDMKGWGIKSIAHCGRLRAEINKMKRRVQ